MPELPEVETIACDLRRRGLAGSTIEAVTVYHHGVIRGEAGHLTRHLTGARIDSVGRHGKLLLIGLSGGDTLAVHLKMTGQVYLVPPGEDLLKHTHVVLGLSGGRELRFRDIRRFGYLNLLSPGDLQGVLSALGPDALSVSEADFRKRLSGHRTVVKALLTDQAKLAGLGNIYANEMLFAAGIHPWRSANGLSTPEVARLYRAMRRLLAAAIKCRGSSISDFVDSSGRPGSFQDRHQVYHKERCPRCGGRVVREVRGTRSAFFCPTCQPAEGAA